MPSTIDDLLAMPPLQLADVSVFLISPTYANEQLYGLERYLDHDDKLRLAKFSSQDLRHRFIRARAALRCILSTFCDNQIPETDWRFGAIANGKPCIRAPKTSIASFNLSYANSFIGIALSQTVEVGIDIEVEHAIPDDEIPWHLFSQEEQQLLKATPKKDFSNAFFRLWTLKEAIAKQTGQGFATEFSEINTLGLSIIEEMNEIDRSTETENLLFHHRLIVDDNPLHLAISAASKSRKGEG